MPVGVRKHHEIAAAHDHRLALAFAVHPSLPAPNEVERWRRSPVESSAQVPQ